MKDRFLERKKVERLISKTKGRFFRIVFVKVDGLLRTLTAQVPTKQGISTERMSWDPFERGYFIFHSPKVGYRMAHLDRIVSIHCGPIQEIA